MVTLNSGKITARALLAIAIMVDFFCTSCAPKFSEVKAEVEKAVPVGKSITLAASQLGASGFRCSGVSPVQCGRIIHSCMEQVVIFADEHYMVTRAEVDGVHCLYTP
jgi:hypothetical protein